MESQELSDQKARVNVKKIIEKFEIVDLTADLIQSAFKEESLPDFEDCIQFHSAKVVDCKTIVTRNVKDFKKIELDVFSPEEFLAVILADSDQNKKRKSSTDT